VAAGDDRVGREDGSTASIVSQRRPHGERHCLVVWLKGAARAWPLPPHGEAVVGRSEPADILIDSPGVSRRHALIRTEGTRVVVEDLQSRNRTRVNGERLSGERTLQYGDVITFGDVSALLDEHQPESSEAAELDFPPEGFVLELGERTVLVADPVMLHVYTQLERLAASQLSVLIVGETGTGKDLAAAALHFWSKRRERPFVGINCSAVPEALAESELFGYERGAFSGADREKPGLLESATGGTVFLDEIGDLPLAIQPKLLRVLEARKVTRLGSTRERSIDIRIVAATHRELSAEVEKGTFRQDLYYRLSPAVLHLPPLRERHRELRLLARRFLGEACASLGRPALALGDAAADRLLAHDWPGNVRELKNVMEYVAATLPEGPVLPEHVAPRAAPPSSLPVPPAAGSTPAAQSFRSVKEEFEQRSIQAALVSTGGNKTRAAKLLGMPLRTLMWKLKRFGSSEGES
jgi:transcriptional regulator with PAS, ATPase and Fis domain